MREEVVWQVRTFGRIRPICPSGHEVGASQYNGCKGEIRMVVTVSDVIADFVSRMGTRHIFGLPGGDSLPLMQACHSRGIEFVLTNHETSAGFMADAYSLLTDKPGVCLTTLGPGATNAISAAAQAMLERSPVLFITAQMPSLHQGAMTHQMIDTDALYRTVTKWSATVTPENVTAVMKRALRTMYGGRPGPVHLSLAGDVASAEVAGSEDRRVPADLGCRAVACPESIARAKAMIADAKRPLMLVGLGIYASPCTKALRQFVKRQGIPALYTPKVKGVIPEDWALAVGSVGLGMAADPTMRELIDASDCVLAVGFDQVELVVGWRDMIGPDTRLLWIDHAPCEDGIYDVDAAVIGRIADSMDTLADGAYQVAWESQEIAGYRSAIRDAVCGEHLPDARDGISPHRITQIVREMVPEDTILASDVGAQKLMNSQLWESYEPKTYLLTNGFSSMGYGLPAAIGAALATSSREPILCFAGDGGFAMTMHELETVVRKQLPIITIVFDDAALSLIETKQRRRGFCRIGVRSARKDYAAIASGFGARGWNVASEQALREAVQGAMATPGPALIGCRIDPGEYDCQL